MMGAPIAPLVGISLDGLYAYSRDSQGYLTPVAIAATPKGVPESPQYQSCNYDAPMPIPPRPVVFTRERGPVDVKRSVRPCYHGPNAYRLNRGLRPLGYWWPRLRLLRRWLWRPVWVSFCEFVGAR